MHNRNHRNLRWQLVFWLACSSLAAAHARAGEPAASDRATAPKYRTIKWEALVPKGWNPMAQIDTRNLGFFSDSDPRADALMNQMREAWDNAPTVGTFDGQPVRVPGYIVPIEQYGIQIREFLLVPYFGACIHSPPPPANQIIHVRMSAPLTGYRMMDVVWVSGTLAAARKPTEYGVSGYRMQAERVEPYVRPKR